ncbi:MAG: iron donor protein CyaY [Burkholderiales bacterium]|nr:iron donor protein CyaY [Burkholderiales bacterium]
MSSIQAESEFNEAVDAVLLAIEQALEQADGDIDFETVGGILTIDCGGGGKIIINRQTPNREIWLAARSGGFHYRLVGREWADTRGGPALSERLRSVVREQGGVDVMFALPGAEIGS